MSKSKADFQIMLWDKEAEHTSSDDLYVRLQNLGLPEEVVSRLHNLFYEVKQIGKRIIRIGKIVLLKIIEFVEKHFFLVAGIGVGVILGAAVASLITSAPVVGSLLAPIAAILKLGVIGQSAVLGHDLDKILPNFGKSIIDIAREFFQLLSTVFNAVMNNDGHSFSTL